VERRRIRREWDEHVIRIDTEKLVNFSRDNLPAEKRW
jgi:hypothetical protein